MVRDELGQQLRALMKKGKTGDRLSLSRLLTNVENNLIQAVPFLSGLKPQSSSIRVGITGPPGAGKSSLVNLLIDFCRKEKLKVAVIAVDPSSPFSGGAILGDRIRMNEHFNDDHVFIRSLGSRGGIGGVSAATGAMATVLESVGFEVVIIETVGVGQTELQIMNLSDATTVVLVPESGDVVQTLKAGILEIADLFVINKCDRPGADVLAHELSALVEQEGEKKRPVLLTSATEKKGIAPWAKEFLNLARTERRVRRTSGERKRRELQSLLLWSLEASLNEKFEISKIENVYSEFAKLLSSNRLKLK